MRRGADLRRGDVERDLDGDDQEDVKQTLARMPDVAMSQKKSCRGADDSHYAPRSADQFRGLNNFRQSQQDNTARRSDSGDEITGAESQRTDCALERRSEHVKREQIESEVNEIVMQKNSADQTPKFTFADYRGEVERAEPVQDDGICEPTAPKLDPKHGHVQENQSDDDGRTAQATRLSQRCIP